LRAWVVARASAGKEPEDERRRLGGCWPGCRPAADLSQPAWTSLSLRTCSRSPPPPLQAGPHMDSSVSSSSDAPDRSLARSDRRPAAKTAPQKRFSVAVGPAAAAAPLHPPPSHAAAVDGHDVGVRQRKPPLKIGVQREGSDQSTSPLQWIWSEKRADLDVFSICAQLLAPPRARLPVARRYPGLRVARSRHRSCRPREDGSRGDIRREIRSRAVVGRRPQGQGTLISACRPGPPSPNCAPGRSRHDSPTRRRRCRWRPNGPAERATPGGLSSRAQHRRLAIRRSDRCSRRRCATRGPTPVTP